MLNNLSEIVFCLNCILQPTLRQYFATTFLVAENICSMDGVVIRVLHLYIYLLRSLEFDIVCYGNLL